MTTLQWNFLVSNLARLLFQKAGRKVRHWRRLSFSHFVQSHEAGSGILGVLGVSGSGKSSLLAALVSWMQTCGPVAMTKWPAVHNGWIEAWARQTPQIIPKSTTIGSTDWKGSWLIKGVGYWGRGSTLQWLHAGSGGSLSRHEWWDLAT